MPKPDWVTWEDIHELLVKANKVNERKGFSMADLNLPPEKLEKKIENGGVYVVAMYGEKLVGVSAYNYDAYDYWFCRGRKVACKCMTGILKSFQGCGILIEMDKLLDECVKKDGCDMIMADTAECNLTIRKEAEKSGQIEMVFTSYKNRDYYSVIFGKWLGHCPYPNVLIKSYYFISKVYTKVRFKKGRIERFRVVEFLRRMVKKKKH